MSSTTIPKTMRGILLEETGGADKLLYKTELPVPEIKDGEILVKNDFAGINYIDIYFRSGIYPSKKPEILGREGEGTIVATSSSYKGPLKPSDKVVWMSTGGYAEFTSVPSTHLCAVPEWDLPAGTAVASILQGLTALTQIRESHPCKEGEWYLVHAAAGGVGLLLCQMLKAIGAHVIGTASTEEKRELAKKNGAEVVLDSNDKEWVKKVKELTPGGEGVNAVFDGVGKTTFDGSLECLRRKGTMVSFGNASGVVDPVPLTKLTPKNLKLTRPTLFAAIATHAEFTMYAEELFQMIKDKKVEILISKVYDLEDVQQAHKDMEGRKTTGKLLLKI